MAGWALGKTIRLGDLRRGFGLAMESEDRDLCLECAQIFEEMKQWNDAAALYERADLPDKAAMIYILETKSLSAAAKLMPRIKSPKIFVLFAKGLLSTVLLPPPPLVDGPGPHFGLTESWDSLPPWLKPSSWGVFRPLGWFVLDRGPKCNAGVPVSVGDPPGAQHPPPSQTCLGATVPQPLPEVEADQCRPSHASHPLPSQGEGGQLQGGQGGVRQGRGHGQRGAPQCGAPQQLGGDQAAPWQSLALGPFGARHPGFTQTPFPSVCGGGMVV